MAPIKSSILTEVVKFATLPISMAIAFNSLFAYPETKNVNELNPKGRLTGERKVAYSKPMDTEVILDKLKKLGISFNEFVFALVTLSLSELIEQADEVQACVPFTLRDFPETFKDLKAHNDFACLPKMLHFPKDGEGKRIKLCKNSVIKDDERFKSTLVKVMQQTKQSVRSSKSKFEAIGWYYMMKYFIFLLRPVLNFKPQGVATNYFAVLSIVPGPKKPFRFAIKGESGENVEVKSLSYFVPGQGRVGNGISVITNGKQVQVGVLCDTSYFKGDAHKRFVKLFEEMFELSVNVL